MNSLADAAVDAALSVFLSVPAQVEAAMRRLTATFPETEPAGVEAAFTQAVRMLDVAESLAFDYWRPDGDPQKLTNDEARERLRQQCPGFEGRSYDRAMARGQADTCH